MTFLYPMMLWALALPLLLAVFALLRNRRAGKGWQRLVFPGHAAELVVKTPAWRSALPAALALLALVAGILAAARPINGYTTTEALATGRNLLIALDISRSMETQDVKPSRLEEARAAAFELVDALPGDKIGLIVFSGEADLVVPLTYDHTALRDALEQVNRGWAGYGGTNFGLVLKKAMQDFARSAPTGTNALVIFSDGEDTVGSSLDLAREAREKHLLVITVGVGTSIGDSIPDARGENGLYQDAAGKHVISKLDTAALQRFAEATGGSYFTMGGGADLTAFAREAVKKLDTHEESFSGHKVPRDLFAPFAITALLLLAASILLGTQWRLSRGGAARLLLIALLTLAVSPLHAAPAEESIRAYEEALGHMSSDADKAREAFSRALLDADSQIQAACLYQLGNMNARATFERLRALYGQGAAHAQTPAEADEEGTVEADEPMGSMPTTHQPTPEQLQEIVDALGKDLQPYRDALSIHPGLKEARTNIHHIEDFIEKLREEIERLKQQQNQQQQQNPQNQQQNEQDDQQDNQQDGQQGDGDNQQQDNQQNEQEQPQNNQQNQNDQPEDGQDDQPDQQGEQEQQPREQDSQQPRNHQQEQRQEQLQAARPQQAEQRPMSEQEKAQQRAASILRMHVDEEKGSPIPHLNDAVRPPEKDY